MIKRKLRSISKFLIALLCLVFILPLQAKAAEPVVNNIPIIVNGQWLMDENQTRVYINESAIASTIVLLRSLGYEVVWDTINRTLSVTGVTPSIVPQIPHHSSNIVGTTITGGNFDISIKSIDIVEYISLGGGRGYTASPGNHIVIFDVTVRNNGTRAERLLGRVNSPRIIFDGGFIYNPVIMRNHPDELHGVTIQPLASRNGIIAFNIPIDVITSGKPFMFTFFGSEFIFSL